MSNTPSENTYARGFWAWAVANENNNVMSFTVASSKTNAINELTGREVGDPERDRVWRHWKKRGARLVRVYVESIARIVLLEQVAALAKSFASGNDYPSRAQHAATLLQKIADLDAQWDQ